MFLGMVMHDNELKQKKTKPKIKMDHKIYKFS